MSLRLLLGLTALLLAAPRALLPGRPGPPPEIRGGLRPLWWLNVFYCKLMHRLEASRMAPLPAHGPALLIANHTSGVDHLLLQASSRRVLGFLIAREFFDPWYSRPICRLLGCIPVRRDGRDLGAARAALRALKEGRVVPIFPEGRITPESGRVIGPGKPGAAFIALHAKVPVIPAYICGTPPTRDVLKVLVWPSHARVVYGDPIPPAELAGDPGDRATLDAVTDRLMAAIRALKERPADEA